MRGQAGCPPSSLSSDTCRNKRIADMLESGRLSWAGQEWRRDVSPHQNLSHSFRVLVSVLLSHQAGGPLTHFCWGWDRRWSQLKLTTDQQSTGVGFPIQVHQDVCPVTLQLQSWETHGANPSSASLGTQVQELEDGTGQKSPALSSTSLWRAFIFMLGIFWLVFNGSVLGSSLDLISFLPEVFILHPPAFHHYLQP